MKHIILITAYAEVEHLIEQLTIYDADSDFHVYIHRDKKHATTALINKLAAHPSVKRVCSSYAINWGGRNQLAAMIELCRYALEDLSLAGNPPCFIHSISGTDILIHSLVNSRRSLRYIQKKVLWSTSRFPIRDGVRGD